MDDARSPIPDRLRGAGLLMVLGGFPWVVLAAGTAFGAHLSGEGGLRIGGTTVFVVSQAMLPWLAPISLATAVLGVLVYYGRGLRGALVVLAGWIVLGLALINPFIAIAAGFVAWLIATGRRTLVLTSSGPATGV